MINKQLILINCRNELGFNYITFMQGSAYKGLKKIFKSKRFSLELPHKSVKRMQHLLCYVGCDTLLVYNVNIDTEVLHCTV